MLSPTLFALYINDMHEGLPYYARSFQYPDDTSIVVRGGDLVCSKISCWLRKWRLKANCVETDLLVFYGSLDNPVLSGEKISATARDKSFRNNIWTRNCLLINIKPDVKIQFNKNGTC